MFLSQFGASDPSLGHPAPDRLVLVVVGEFGHAFTVSSVSQEFLRKDHPAFLLQSYRGRNIPHNSLSLEKFQGTQRLRAGLLP
jgi:hypothetical protein